MLHAYNPILSSSQNIKAGRTYVQVHPDPQSDFKSNLSYLESPDLKSDEDNNVKMAEDVTQSIMEHLHNIYSAKGLILGTTSQIINININNQYCQF